MHISRYVKIRESVQPREMKIYLFTCVKAEGPVALGNIRCRGHDPMRSGCSSSGRSIPRGASCIRSVFNVSFSHRFMGGYLTQIWSIYVRSSPRSHFSRPPIRLHSCRGSTQFGARNAFPHRLFWHISSYAFRVRARFRPLPRANANINNRSRDSRRAVTRRERRFRTRITNRECSRGNFSISHAHTRDVGSSSSGCSCERRTVSRVVCYVFSLGCWSNDGARRMINARVLLARAAWINSRRVS